MKKLLAILTLSVALMTPAFAQSGTAKTKAALTTEINTDFADNTTNAITATALRQVTLDMVQSWVDYLACAAQGSVVYYDAAPAPVCLAPGTSGQIFKTQGAGANPAWSNIAALLTQGTGITISGTTNATIGLTSTAVTPGTYGSTTQCAAITVNQQGQITSASAVTCTPAVSSLTGLGTGVATALGTNIGAAGAFVTFNGALGTPSSGTLTSATGLPISTGLTGAGTGVLTALGTNVGSAGAFVVFNGAGGTPSSMTATNLTGTASALTAGNVTTNANLTGDVTSVGNAATLASSISGAKAFTTSVAVGGATIGANVFAAGSSNSFTVASNGVTVVGGNTTFTNNALLGSNSIVANSAGNLIGYNGAVYGWNSAGSVALGTTAFDTNISRSAAGVVQIGTTAANASGSLLFTGLTASGAAVILSGLGSDTATTDVTLCSKSSDGTVLKGTGTLGICLGTSSERFKEDVVPLDVGLKEIMGLQPVKFRLDAAHGDPNKLMYGFTAEQGGAVLPALMGRDAEGNPNTFDYLGLVPALIKAVQTLVLIFGIGSLLVFGILGVLLKRSYCA